MDLLLNAYETWEEDAVKCTVQISTQNIAQTFGQFGQLVECAFMNEVVLGSSPVAVIYTLDFTPASSKQFLNNGATMECEFTLKSVRDMKRRYSQMHRTDKYSK